MSIKIPVPDIWRNLEGGQGQPLAAGDPIPPVFALRRHAAYRPPCVQAPGVAEARFERDQRITHVLRRACQRATARGDDAADPSHLHHVFWITLDRELHDAFWTTPGTLKAWIQASDFFEVLEDPAGGKRWTFRPIPDEEDA